MNLREWIDQNKPGQVTLDKDFVEILHEDDDTSILWLNKDQQCPAILLGLGEIFEIYDGIDLFSSTFKIASIETPKIEQNVKITFTLKEIEDEFLQFKATPPEQSTPFMRQAGIGIYLYGNLTEKIYLWDTELLRFTSKYENIYSIFDKWLSDVS
jgi:hypothetical protein